jgi:hypothetical protein
MEQYLLSSIRILMDDDFHDWRRQLDVAERFPHSWSIVCLTQLDFSKLQVACVSLEFPGPIINGHPLREPRTLQRIHG